MWRQWANHSLSLRWAYKSAPWEFQTKLLHYFFTSNNISNLHFTYNLFLTSKSFSILKSLFKIWMSKSLFRKSNSFSGPKPSLLCNWCNNPRLLKNLKSPFWIFKSRLVFVYGWHNHRLVSSEDPFWRKCITQSLLESPHLSSSRRKVPFVCNI